MSTVASTRKKAKGLGCTLVKPRKSFVVDGKRYRYCLHDNLGWLYCANLDEVEQKLKIVVRRSSGGRAPLHLVIRRAAS
jgi:hypothetical protein